MWLRDGEQEVNPVPAGIHLRVLRILRFHLPCLLPAQPQRGLSGRKENGTANHAEHAKGGGALQGQDDALDLKAWLAENE